MLCRCCATIHHKAVDDQHANLATRPRRAHAQRGDEETPPQECIAHCHIFSLDQKTAGVGIEITYEWGYAYVNWHTHCLVMVTNDT